jgi:hypothetical protein
MSWPVQTREGADAPVWPTRPNLPHVQVFPTGTKTRTGMETMTLRRVLRTIVD